MRITAFGKGNVGGGLAWSGDEEARAVVERL
jgi:hypothetical protein